MPPSATVPIMPISGNIQNDKQNAGQSKALTSMMVNMTECGKYDSKAKFQEGFCSKPVTDVIAVIGGLFIVYGIVAK